MVSKTNILDLCDRASFMHREKIAVVCGSTILRYSDINRLSSILSASLLKLGARKGDRVALWMNKGINLPIGVLGILRAGCTFIIISEREPVERVMLMLKQADCKFVLCTQNNINQLPIIQTKAFVIDQLLSVDNEPETSQTLFLDRKDDDIAYIIFTSGSTGKPKPVVISDSALTHYIKWFAHRLRQEADLIDLPLSSSPCFAAGISQLFAPLVLGRTLHILQDEIVKDPPKLFEWYRLNPSFGLYCVPTLWREFLNFAERQHELGYNLTPPRGVFLSGEAASVEDLSRALNLWPWLRLWNLYGPTEYVANASAGELISGQTVSLGHPIDETELLLLNERQQLVNPGETGEIWLSGPGLANGYLNDPYQTAERFVENPWRRGQRMFRTGDYGILGDDGFVHFLGRQDSQIKVRGHRVQLEEIEAVISAHPLVQQAAVKQFEPAAAVAAYIAIKPKVPLEPGELKTYIQARLPDYMMPGSITLIDRLPQLANGKIDRNSLPLPSSERGELSYKYVPPEDPLEAHIIRIWERVLRIQGVGANDDFFDLGGNSLRAIAAIALIRDELKYDISPTEFFSYSTPKKLAKVTRNPVQLTAPRPTNEVRCHENQEALWLLHNAFPSSRAYNLQFTISFEGPLNVDALEKAINLTVTRHDSLRCVFVGVKEPELVIESPQWIPLPILDLQEEQSFIALQQLERKQRLALEARPPVRFKLCRLNELLHKLLVTVHHIIFDGESVLLFFEELIDNYTSSSGDPKTEPPGANHFSDWLNRHHGRMMSAQREIALDFWRERLQGTPHLRGVPTDYPRSPQPDFSASVLHQTLAGPLVARLKEIAREERSTLFMVMFAGFAMVLAQYTNQQDVLVGVPVANRGQADTQKTIGYLANLMVLRCQVEPNLTFREFLHEVRDITLAALNHQWLPFDTLVRSLPNERRIGSNPWVSVSFALHEVAVPRLIDANLLAKVQEEPAAGSKYDFSLENFISENSIEQRLTYNKALFAEGTMARLQQSYIELLGLIAADPKDKLDQYLPLSPETAREITEDWNATEVSIPEDIGIHRLVELSCQLRPAAVAVRDTSQTLSYENLEHRANQLAHYLKLLGADMGSKIGIQLEPSAEMIIAILAVWKLGAAYVPLDAAYPPERVNYMIEDSDIEILLSDGPLRLKHQSRTRQVLLRDEQELIESMPGDSSISVAVAPEALAYIIYTSGSTGKPKGVCVTHRGVGNYLLWMARTFPLGSEDRVLNKTSINFDISVWEMLLPLVVGAQLVVASRCDIKDPESLASLIRNQGVTQIQFVPSALRAFVDAGVLGKCPTLRRIFAGGEALPLRLQQDVFATFTGELHNLYGPTEASIYSCHWICRREEPLRTVPIGGPISNTQIHILDAEMRPVPPGVAGEIYIGGFGVAQGYHNQPDLTSRAFVPDTFAPETGRLLFKTGDQARRLEAGRIEYLGRSDKQVKVRGHRIELGDIEQNLATHPDVGHVHVIVREENSDDIRTVAYLTSAPGSHLNEEELRTYLRARLPEFMIPQRFMILSELPLLPNNKINLAALPQPQPTKRRVASLKTKTHKEAALTSIWEKLLQTTPIGPEDNFFDLGGHSLLLARLSREIKEQMGASVTIVDLFRYPTIAAMAQHLSRVQTQKH